MSVRSRMVLLFVLLATLGVSAQARPQPLIPPHALDVKVVLFGHSWVYLMQGFQPWAFPNIPANHIVIKGFPGYACAQLLPLLYAWVPASTDAAFLMAATNDIAYRVPVSEHIACMTTMIDRLIGENPHMLVLVSNVPPFGISTLPALGDNRAAIAEYNQAYVDLARRYPENVRLVDLWTPMVDTNGWGLAHMFSDGVHFGPNGQDLVMGTIRDALYSGLAR